MKILVPVKRVPDFNVKVCVKSDSSGGDMGNVNMWMNPFDEIAAEEAGKATEIVAVPREVTHCQESLRAVMAAGADR